MKNKNEGAVDQAYGDKTYQTVTESEDGVVYALSPKDPLNPLEIKLQKQFPPITMEAVKALSDGADLPVKSSTMRAVH